jgi:acyl carrier protein
MDNTVYSILDHILRSMGIKDQGDLNLEDDLIEVLKIDSMQFVELIASMERTTGIKVADEDFIIENFTTLQSLIDYFEARTAAIGDFYV